MSDETPSGGATVVTGVGLALPGALVPAGLAAADDTGPTDGATPVDPAARIGKKGLRYKDRATQLALVAAHDALRAAGLAEGEGRAAALTAEPTSVGVVASSNYGNLDSVCDVVTTVAEAGSTRLVSPITVPNLSSNVIASEVAIRFTLRGPNLTVCNGPTSGLDAIRWALTWLAGGRAQRVLVLGAEPDNPVVRELLAGRPGLDGAVALVLETAASAAERGAPPLAVVDRYARTGDVAGVVAALRLEADELAGWYPPESELDGDPLPGVARLDAPPGPASSGALGVLWCAAATGRLRENPDGAVLALAGGGAGEDAAGVLMRSAAP
ncbi:beta-ketoacyl synthase N-terminal-like domain-containing protein [Streptomyces profundus]|uniref:beta-ketoacyl synthase N-terminal-like domain-containing protein n=1 Tax=Streptomyces profundus TaxID=2867410 RepID=UPI001D16F1D6|nr:beta-ketoacyl synthase N-terminal-like domain-containing protein [Streptomyces sp. MA3_2.13]UED85087.1 beta-ketoacyl synthase [Streptomyces sp. MA3_2.13]